PFPVSWSAQDAGAGVATYRVEVDDGGVGAWRTLYERTTDTSASFAGVPGQTYDFRVTATDLAGNAGLPSAIAQTAVSADAAPDHGPSVSFASPTAGATFGDAGV